MCLKQVYNAAVSLVPGGYFCFLLEMGVMGVYNLRPVVLTVLLLVHMILVPIIGKFNNCITSN